MILTTTPNIEGFVIKEYLGPIVVNKVFAVGITGDMMAKITDLVGGSAYKYENALENGIKEVLAELVNIASREGAHAVVNININITTFSTGKGGFFVVSCSGTAVKGGLAK